MWFDLGSWSNEPSPTMDSKHTIKSNQKMLLMKDKTKYKKKITPAFPKRSSSLQTARTLQANNRSLALSLEKMRHEFLRAHTHLTRLKKNNNQLKDEVYELKHRQMGKTFEKELNKICKERFGNVKKKIFILNNLATEFVDTLTDLSEICFSSSFSEPVALSRMSSPCSTPNNRRADEACFAPSHTDNRSDFEVQDASLKPCTSLRNTRILEKSFNKDQSSLSSSNENISAFSDSPLIATSNSDSSASMYLKKNNSQSKLSEHRQSRKQKKHSNKSVKNATSIINLTKNTDSPQKIPKQESSMKKSNGFTSCSTIKDISPPQLEVVCHRDGKNEKISMNTPCPQQDSGDVELKASISAENKHRKRNDIQSQCLPMVWSSSSLEELSVLTFDMPSELVKPNKTHKSDSHKKRSSPMRKPLNHKKNSNNFSSVDMNKAGNFSSSEVDIEYDNNVKKYPTKTNYITTSPHCFPFVQNDGTDNLTNENSEVVLHDELSNISLSASSTSSRDNIKTGALKISSVGKNKQKEHKVVKHDGLSNISLSASSTSSRDNIKTGALKTYSVGKNKQKEHKPCMTKSERFLDELEISNSDLFSHESKTIIESIEDHIHDSSCKTKLKPKNVKAGKRGNHVRRNSQPRLDLKGKSPTLSNSKKHKVKPVSNLSANQLICSPPLYFKKDRSRSKNKKRGTKQYSSAEVRHTNNSSSKQVAHFLSSLNYSRQEIFGTNHPVADANYRTESSSQYGEQNQCKNNKSRINKHMQSKLKQMRPKISSVGSTISEPMDISLELTESAPEIMTHCSKLLASDDLLNIDDSNSQILTGSEANSHTEFEISDFAIDESETSFKTCPDINNLTPVEHKTVSSNSPDPKTEMMIHSSRKENEDALCVPTSSYSDINAETCDTLPNSFLSDESRRLEEEEGGTSNSLVSLNSSIENCTNRREIEQLMDDIKHLCFSLDISFPNSEETCIEYECSESEFLACSELDAECEETNTLVEDMQNNSEDN